MSSDTQDKASEPFSRSLAVVFPGTSHVRVAWRCLDKVQKMGSMSQCTQACLAGGARVKDAGRVLALQCFAHSWLGGTKPKVGTVSTTGLPRRADFLCAAG